ncbi:hypothetical protein HK096_007696, partial [Nowakowskiella sp. JEL0078]
MLQFASSETVFRLPALAIGGYLGYQLLSWIGLLLTSARTTKRLKEAHSKGQTAKFSDIPAVIGT